jgi:hypothetical protein
MEAAADGFRDDPSCVMARSPTVVGRAAGVGRVVRMAVDI